MNDDRTILDIEARLARAFHADGLPPAPASLLDRIEGISDAAVLDGQLVRPRPNRRTAFWLVGLAALLAVGGVVALGGGRASDPIPPAPSGPLGTVVTYEVQWTAATPFDATTLAREVAVVQRRLEIVGAAGATARSEGSDRLLVTIPGGVDPDPYRQIVGQSGVVTFVPLGTTNLLAGDSIDPSKFPALFGSAGIADARVETNAQMGQRVIQFDLTPDAAALFGDYTAAHIGQYFAIAVDGRVLSAPVINSAIQGGSVEITKGGVEGGYPLAEAQQLVAILVGPLPAPLVEISNTIRPIDPAPSASAAPDPSAGTFPLRRMAGTPECDLVLVAAPYRWFELRIDATAVEPVLAITNSGAQLAVLWGSTFVGRVGPPPFVVDANGAAVQTGTRVTIPDRGWPSLGGHFVCPGFGSIAVYDEPAGSPEPIPASFELERIVGDVGCDTIIPPYAGFSLQIDPTADHPVLAATETGLRLPVLWGSEFRGSAGPPAVVVDARGFEYESSAFVAVRGVAVPALGDHFVCPAPDAVYIFNEPPPS